MHDTLNVFLCLGYPIGIVVVHLAVACLTSAVSVLRDNVLHQANVFSEAWVRLQ
jgi:hypothetical protein